MQDPILPEPGSLSLLREQCIAQWESEEERSACVKQLFEFVGEFYKVLTEAEHRPMHSLFARMVYASSKFSFPKQLNFAAQCFRKETEIFLLKGSEQPTLSAEELHDLGFRVVNDLFVFVKGQHAALPFEDALLSIGEILKQQQLSEAVRFRMIRGQAVGISMNNKTLDVVLDDHLGTRINLLYHDQSDTLTQAREIERAVGLIGFPLSLNLVELVMQKEGPGRARMIVIEPDYLVDVTSVSESFEYGELAGAMHLLKKYLPVTSSQAILLGNIANYFLDRLVHEPDLDFKTTFRSVFRLHPIVFLEYSDEQLHELMRKARVHFNNLCQAVKEIFPKEGIEREQCYIEPSFYVPAFGLQGRLDLFHKRNDQAYDIIELKSGRPFKANSYGLNQKHFVQTLLYDLMVKAAKGFRISLSNYILYSSQHERTLRYAPSTEALQRQAMSVRNQIVLAEFALYGNYKERAVHPLSALLQLNPESFDGFTKRDLTRFISVFAALSPLERNYVEHLSSFISREQFLAKVGMHGAGHANGLASLWLEPADKKDKNFELLKDLKLNKIQTDENATYLIFDKGPHSNPLANFRIGDIVVLYPETGDRQSVLKAQVHKSTIVALDVRSVTIQLRAKQINTVFLESVKHWNIEHDVLDSGFLKMQKALFSFASADIRKRALFMGTESPAKHEDTPIHLQEALSPEHRDILSRILQARDYFLLWGPPGTGKTTIILKHLVKHLHTHSNDRILLLAFTNRAVDEMCSAINTLGSEYQTRYIRIGSRSGTAEEHRSRLLTNLMEQVDSRGELKRLLMSQRIVVSTVASILGKEEIFNVLKFQHAIIDEASQILDPMLCSILPRIGKWVLIGDHKQLPAVVVQDEYNSRVSDESLMELGITDLRNSFFERMFRSCRERGWTWAYGKLQTQGRMHADIMAFSGAHFYDNELKVLEDHPERNFRQQLDLKPGAKGSSFSKLLARERMIFIPSRPYGKSFRGKTHLGEAAIVSKLIATLIGLHGRGVSKKIGIIVPFRAQIAAIRQALGLAGIDPDAFLIDTVERYQGAAYDIILLSMSIQHITQLRSITSISDDGIDRKLNVAITRAREQFILIGQDNLIRESPLYLALSKTCVRLEPPVEIGDETLHTITQTS